MIMSANHLAMEFKIGQDFTNQNLRVMPTSRKGVVANLLIIKYPLNQFAMKPFFSLFVA